MLTEQIKQKAKALGFELVGIAPATRPPETEFYQQWIEQGFAGGMDYMTRNIEKRKDCRQLFPPARSVIVCGLSYHSKKNSSPLPSSLETRKESDSPSLIKRESRGGGFSTGRISSYARSDDYHTVLKNSLFRLLEFIRQESAVPVEAKVCVDTVPILERLYAYYAGLGWIGKHGGVINPKYGSWFFLGEILLNLTLDYDSPQPDRCGECLRCLEACPTGALVAPRFLDARRCLSYLTIEYRGIIPEELRAPLGNCVFGCDRCQSVCPWNQKAAAGNSKAFSPRNILLAPRLDWLAALTQEEFTQVFKNNPVKRSKLRGLLRNSAIAIGNSNNLALLPVLRQLHERADELVRPHSVWALEKLNVKS